MVPDSFRQFRQGQPDAELQLSPLSSLDQVQAVRSGRLDAGFVFNMPKTDPELDQVLVASQQPVLAVPKGNPLTRLMSLRLRDLTETDFVWFPRRQSPAYYDRLMACSRGGLKTPRIVQEAVDQATLLALVACRLGVAFVSDATRWRRPKEVVLKPVLDLHVPIAFSLVWRKDNVSPLLARFVAGVRQLPEARALARRLAAVRAGQHERRRDQA